MPRAPGTSCARRGSRASSGVACGGWAARIRAVWTALAALRPEQAGAGPFGAAHAAAIPTSQGAGEILRIEATPTDGSRTVTADSKRPDPRRDTTHVLPTPYVVRRTGFRPGLVALTFDDGPDADWTPKILDILKQKARPGDLLHRRRECARAIRPAQPDRRRGPRARQSQLHPSQYAPAVAARRSSSSSTPPSGWSRPIPGAACACSARPISATPSRPRRRARAGAGRPAARLSQCRPPRRHRGLAAARASTAIVDNAVTEVLRRQCGPLGQYRPAPRRRRRPRADGGGAAADHRCAAGAGLSLRPRLASWPALPTPR